MSCVAAEISSFHGILCKDNSTTSESNFPRYMKITYGCLYFKAHKIVKGGP